MKGGAFNISKCRPETLCEKGSYYAGLAEKPDYYLAFPEDNPNLSTLPFGEKISVSVMKDEGLVKIDAVIRERSGDLVIVQEWNTRNDPRARAELVTPEIGNSGSTYQTLRINPYFRGGKTRRNRKNRRQNKSRSRRS